MKPITTVAAIGLLSIVSAHSAEPEAREWAAKNGTVVKYRWSQPEKIEPGKVYPLVLFLHGAGERGTDNTAHLKHGIRPILAGAEKLDQPIFLIAPQCPQGRWWAPANMEKMELSEAKKSNDLLDAVMELAGETMKKQPVDKDRFYVTGISMGGFATWYLLGRTPEKIAAAVPICGGGDPSLAKRFKDVPIWTFHGEKDPAVPVRTTRDMVAALEKAGGKPKVTYYPEVEHDSWTQTYEDPEVFRWLFEQKKK